MYGTNKSQSNYNYHYKQVRLPENHCQMVATRSTPHNCWQPRHLCPEKDWNSLCHTFFISIILCITRETTKLTVREWTITMTSNSSKPKVDSGYCLCLLNLWLDEKGKYTNCEQTCRIIQKKICKCWEMVDSPYLPACLFICQACCYTWK